MTSTTEHAAAVCESKGSPLTVVKRTTPNPGLSEVLVEVKSIALNPIDYYMRDFGFLITSYPAIIGSDIGGMILAAGSSTSFKLGTRVTAFAQIFFVQGATDYGASQAKALIPAANVAQLPGTVSLNEASLLPMSVVTARSGWYSIGLPLQDTLYKPADKKGVMVWDRPATIGSPGIQKAKTVGMTVCVTASPKHHEYLESRGAKETFDYHDNGAVEKIVKAAKGDDITLEFSSDAAGQLRACLDVLKEFKAGGTPKLAIAVPMSDQTPTEGGVDVKFVAAPTKEKSKMEFFEFVMNQWLMERLEKGEYKPSPAIKVVEGGLGVFK
ncbi:MAG: hypothetical protein Q9215_007996 [Flavoplaca cf. flavocitrina]